MAAHLDHPAERVGPLAAEQSRPRAGSAARPRPTERGPGGDVGDRDQHRGGQTEDDRLEARIAAHMPRRGDRSSQSLTARRPRSMARASPTVTTEPVTSTPPEPRRRRTPRRPRPARLPGRSRRRARRHGDPVVAEDCAGGLGEHGGGHGARGRVLGDDQVGQVRLEGREHALVVLVGHHADHPDQRRERERVLERGGGRRGSVRVVRGVEHDRRAAPDDLQPAGQVTSANAGAHQVVVERLVADECLDGGQCDGGVLRLVGAVERQEHLVVPPRSPCSDSIWPPTAGTRETTPNSMPSRTQGGADLGGAARSATSATSGGCSARTAIAPGLMMPAFSAAMSTGPAEVASRGRPRPAGPRRPPRRRRWSRPRSRPCPTSTTAASTGASAKAVKAIPTIGLEEGQRVVGCAASTRWVYGAMSLKARTNCSSVSGSPSMEIRSFIRSTCGLVNRPVRRSIARSRVSIIRDVESCRWCRSGG